MFILFLAAFPCRKQRKNTVLTYQIGQNRVNDGKLRDHVVSREFMSVVSKGCVGLTLPTRPKSRKFEKISFFRRYLHFCFGFIFVEAPTPGQWVTAPLFFLFFYSFDFDF